MNRKSLVTADILMHKRPGVEREIRIKDHFDSKACTYWWIHRYRRSAILTNSSVSYYQILFHILSSILVLQLVPEQRSN